MLKRRSGLKRQKNGLKGSRLRPVSKKRSKVNREYMALRLIFLRDHPYCEWWLMENHLPNITFFHSYPYNIRVDYGMPLDRIPKATEIHHKRGRGRYLLDTSTWMAVSRAGHDAIHADPKTSYEKGYMLPR